MFCVKCGNKLADDVRFCVKCGTAVNTPSVPNTPPPTEAFGSVTNDVRTGNHERADVGSKSMEQIAEDYKLQTKIKPLENTQDQTDQVSYQDPPKTTELPTKINKLLLIASIITPVISIVLVNIYTGSGFNYFQDPSEFLFTVFLVVMPTILNILGQRKNSRKLILAAGIMYALTGVFLIIAAGYLTLIGIFILSAIICFIAFAKMKKQE
jgi:hypothetical protein